MGAQSTRTKKLKKKRKREDLEEKGGIEGGKKKMGDEIRGGKCKRSPSLQMPVRGKRGANREGWQRNWAGEKNGSFGIRRRKGTLSRLVS